MDLLDAWNKASIPALQRAGNALKEFSGLDFTLETSAVRSVSWDALDPTLAETVTEPLYAIHLGTRGLFNADLFLLFSVANSERLASAMVGEPLSAPFDELGTSVLAEVGNVVGTAFLNVFSDLFHAKWEPLPPDVDYLDSVAFGQALAEGKTVLLTQAVFRVTGESIAGAIAVAVPLATQKNA